MKAKYPINLPPKAAIEYFKSKENIFSWDWFDVWQEAHSKAFTVAKVVRMDILTDIRDMVEKSIKDGITLQQFKKELEPKLKAKGWWGKQTVDGKEVQLGSPYRLKTIYQTNLKTAYSAGRYKAMMDNKENRPYWQYRTREDPKVRDEHRLLNKKVFHSDDEFWNHFYPPNGWRCRCYIVALKESDIKKEGLKISSSKGSLYEEDRPISRKSNIEKPAAVYTDPSTGKQTATAPGWNYNPGRAKWDPELSKYSDGLIEQYKRDVYTNTKIARVIDEYARKDVKDYFKMDTGLTENSFCETQKEYDEILKKLEEKLGEEYDRTRLTRAFYHSNKITYSPEIINNARTGTVKNGVKTIVHENTHAIGRYSTINIKGSPETREFLGEGLAELLTRKFLIDKYGANIDEISHDVYQDECADIAIQLMVKHNFNREAIWKEIREVFTGKNKTGDFESSFTFNTSNVNQEAYDKILIKIKNKGILTKEIEDYMNSPALSIRVKQLVKQKSRERTKDALKQVMKGAIIKKMRIKRNSKLQGEIIKWMLS